MSRLDLVRAVELGHSFSMRRGHPNSSSWALLALVAVSACASSDDANNSADGPYGPDYMLGGQTGSLVPDCGVAPLSEQGHAVPVGDAVAVLYTSGCPDEPVVERVSLAASDVPVMVQLEPLGAMGVYLVRASEMLSEGGYELVVSGNVAQTLMVTAGAVPLPTRLGELHAVPPGDACAGEIEFELELDPQALAYAPLLRLWARIDRGSEQLLVDYGALELADAVETRGSVQLPRCSELVCFSQGGHLLELRAEVAGETLAIETVAAAFDVHCGPTLSGDMQTEETDFNCSSARAHGRSPWVLMLVLGALPRLRSIAARLHRPKPRRS